MTMMARMMGGGSVTDRALDGFPRGLALGLVTENEDPEGLGRIRVKLEVHSEDQQSFWARCATPMAGVEIGLYALPEIGDEVLVGFIAQDPAHPVILGAVWNDGKRPPETNSDGKNDRRLWRSRARHELRFDDGAANEIELTMENGSRVYLAENTAILEDGKGNMVEIRDGSITVKANQKITMSAPQIVIEASGTLEMKAGATCKVRGAMVEIN